MELITLISAGVRVSSMAYDLFKRHNASQNSGRDTIARVATAVRNPEVLLRAVRDGDERLVSNLLELGASDWVNYGHQVRLRTAGGSRTVTVSDFTPLMMAALYDNAAVINLLLDYGADLDAECCDENGLHTALAVAVIYGRVRAANALLQAGADVNSYCTHRGHSLLWMANRAGNSRMCSLLRRYV